MHKSVSTSRACRLALPLCASLLAGCTLGPNFEPPEWASPSSWFSGPKEPVTPPESIPVAEPIDLQWWQLFGDPQLTMLEERVAAENLDVQIAALRLAESRAQLGVTRAAEFPSLNGNASYTREQASNNGFFSIAPGAAGRSANGASGNTTGGIKTGGLQPFDIWQYGFDASWEIDLWGKIRRSVESAEASTEASQEAQRGVLLSSLAEVARDYIQLRATQEQLRIARENVRTAQESLKLTQQRAAGGITTDLDVANASAQLRTFLAVIPRLRQDEAEGINALNLLLGQPPNALREELATPKPIPPVPSRVPVGFPSELARRRPDIRQAEADLHSATADVGVAVANFYPSLTLTGSFGLQSLQLNKAFNLTSKQYSVGPGLTVPIFEGGRLRATLELKKAAQQEAAVAYQKTVLGAWHDVDNALTAYQTEQARRDQLILAVAENRKALALAQSRYQEGVSDFLAVLDAQRNLLLTEQQLADSAKLVSSNLVALYKALGGGWETDLPVRVAGKERQF